MSTQQSLAVQADSSILSDGLVSLQVSLFQAAEANIQTALGDQAGAYSALAVRSMVITEALRLTSGMDLTTIITRGNLIRQIETEGLVNIHPNGYANLTALAAENGVSVGEFSDTRALVDVIFPYVTQTLGLNLLEVWDQIGKSNFREMVPALRSLITGAPADHDSVRNAITAMLNTSAIAIAQEENCDPSEIEDAAVRRHAITTLLNDGAVMPTRQLRRRVRPSRVPTIQMATLQASDEQWYAVLRMETQEQRDLVARVLSSHTDNMTLDARDEEHRPNRRLLSSFFGETE